MCIQRSVLNHYILRHTNTERGEVPHSLDAARNHSIRNLLGYLNGNRQHTDINIVLAHLLFKIIGMEGKKKSEPISDLENLVRIICFWLPR